MRRTRSVILCVAVIIAAFFLIAVQQASADDLLFNRGLPTANLNNAAGADRSNVAWADSESTSTPSEYWLPGDDFTLTSSANVDDITVWIVGAGTTAPGFLPSGLSLFGGDAGGTISQISTTYTSAPVTYTDGTTYQSSSGNYWNLYQVNFAVNLSLSAGQTYDFFVDQPYQCYSASCDTYVNAFLSASNAGLSGSTQEGADGQFLWLDVNGATNTVETWNSDGAGWDKSSDANVQVYGSPVPEPASILLFGSGVLGLGIRLRRRFHI
jgi:hypothetical protein